jgi:hypothetical protein
MVDNIEYYYYLFAVFALMHLHLMLSKFHHHHVPRKSPLNSFYLNIKLTICDNDCNCCCTDILCGGVVLFKDGF